MKHRSARSLCLAVLLALGACATGQEAGDPTNPPAISSKTIPTPASSEPSPTSMPRDIWIFDPLAPIEAGTYFIDPDLDDSTALRVVYDVPEGWLQWIGAAKFAEDGHVGVSITTVTNLVTHGCLDHSWADPPVGPSVDDLVTALADLAPFRVKSPPKDVTIYGYSGKHLEWRVPGLPMEGEGDDRRFAECKEGTLKSWVAAVDATEPGDAFYGYSGPGFTEEFWILDVKGTRLMIAAERSAGSSSGDLAEQRAILDSIRIEL